MKSSNIKAKIVAGTAAVLLIVAGAFFFVPAESATADANASTEANAEEIIEFNGQNFQLIGPDFATCTADCGDGTGWRCTGESVTCVDGAGCIAEGEGGTAIGICD